MSDDQMPETEQRIMDLRAQVDYLRWCIRTALAQIEGRHPDGAETTLRVALHLGDNGHAIAPPEPDQNGSSTHG